MVSGVKEIVEGWRFSYVSIGIPAPIEDNTAKIEPVNLGDGWAGFDFSDAFDLPSKIINDAAMQAIGSYEGGSMLFLGLGTGLGSCMIDRYIVHPTEIAHMPYKNGKTYEECVGEAALEKEGKKSWKETVCDVAEVLHDGLLPDYIVLGGGNMKKFKDDDPLPDFCRRGENTNAFIGGFRMWERQWEKGLP
jgi:polyphosphate glucokinase